VGPAYLAVFNNSASMAVAGTDVFYQCMWCIALFFFTVLAMGYVKGFFSYTNDMSNWIVPFSLTIFAINTIQYYSFATDGLFLVLSLITGAIACASMSVTGLHTLYLIVDGSLWIPKQKWGPISFMKLTHEMMRFILPQFEKRFTDIYQLHSNNNASNNNNSDQKEKNLQLMTTIRILDGILSEFSAFLTVFDEHSHHEDHVLFPIMRRYFPNLNMDLDGEHHLLHAQIDNWKPIIANYETAKKNFLETQNVQNSNGENPELPIFTQALETLLTAFGNDF